MKSINKGLRFAAETEQALHNFFSIDSVPSNETQTPKKKGQSPKSPKQTWKHGPLLEGPQKVLWNQSPCANTKLIAGKLSLCVGMPVMIQVNSATELCITKGQKAVVHSWQTSKTPNNVIVLDVLFVCLIDPPSSTWMACL